MPAGWPATASTGSRRPRRAARRSSSRTPSPRSRGRHRNQGRGPSRPGPSHRCGCRHRPPSGGPCSRHRSGSDPTCRACPGWPARSGRRQGRTSPCGIAMRRPCRGSGRCRSRPACAPAPESAQAWVRLSGPANHPEPDWPARAWVRASVARSRAARSRGRSGGSPDPAPARRGTVRPCRRARSTSPPPRTYRWRSRRWSASPRRRRPAPRPQRNVGDGRGRGGSIGSRGSGSWIAGR